MNAQSPTEAATAGFDAHADAETIVKAMVTETEAGGDNLALYQAIHREVAMIHGRFWTYIAENTVTRESFEDVSNSLDGCRKHGRETIMPLVAKLEARVVDLLATNNKYLQDARDARAEAKRLQTALDTLIANLPA